MVGQVYLALNPYPAFWVYFGLCAVLFALLLLILFLVRIIHTSSVRKRAIHKAMKVTEGLGGNDASCLHGDELAPALKNKAIAYVAFPLSEGAETLYYPPKDSDDPSLFISGRSIVLAVPLEDYDEKISANLKRIVDGYNSGLQSLYGKKGTYQSALLVLANNASEAARVKSDVGKVVIGLSGLIKELLRLSRYPGAYSGEDTLNSLYALFPDIRLLMKEDKDCDPRYVKGKAIVTKKGEDIRFDKKTDGDLYYSFHLYDGRKMQKPRRER
jgi:hypothetical protein